MLSRDPPGAGRISGISRARPFRNGIPFYLKNCCFTVKRISLFEMHLLEVHVEGSRGVGGEGG